MYGTAYRQQRSTARSLSALLDFALDRQASIPNRTRHKRLGEVLLEHRLITPEELEASLRAQRVDRLRSCSLFADFPSEALAKLSDAFEEQTLEDGELLVRQGRSEADLHVLASGELEAFYVGDDHETAPLGVINAGEAIGVTGYLFGGMQIASARAVKRCQVLRAPYDHLRRLMDSPKLAHMFLVAASWALRHRGLLYLNFYQEQRQHLHDVERSLQHINDFLDLSEISAVGTGIEGLIERLVHAVSNLTDADRASLFLVDPANGELWSKVAQGLEVREIRIKPGEGVVGWVAQHKALVNIPDADADDRFQSAVDHRTGYRTRTILCAPIWSLHNEFLGVLQVLNKRHGPFNDHDETLIRGFTYQAAIAVENFNLYHKMMVNNRKMAVLLELATSIGDTLDLSTLIRKIVIRTADAMLCDGSSLFVVDEASKELWSMEVHGTELKEIRFPMSTGLAGHTATTGEVVNIRDAYEDGRFNRAFDRQTGYRTQSVLCVPVVNRDEAITGVIQCLNKRDGAFDDGDVQLLQAIASQISVSLDNAQLHARAVETRNYLESVQQSIASCILTLDEHYQVVIANRATESLLQGMGLQGPNRDIRHILGTANAGLCHMIDEGYEKRTPLTRYDVNLTRSPGDASTVNISVLPLNDAEGAFNGLVLAIEDITREYQVKHAFSHYLAPSVIDEMLADPANLSLGGKKREITALFTDIEGFTSMSETLDPEDLFHLLNEYFDETCDIVFRYNGTIDKIVGDALHVLFNAPLEQADHAEKAIRCAMELDACCQALRERQRQRGPALGRTRIGINTGPSIVGNFGGTTRFDYTAHGDAINTAARLEGANKYVGTHICVSASAMVGCQDIEFRPIGRLVLKGKTNPIDVYEPLAPSVTAVTRLPAYLEAFEDMALGMPKAVEAFEDLARRYPEDGLVNFHASRLRAGQTGTIIQMTEK